MKHATVFDRMVGGFHNRAIGGNCGFFLSVVNVNSDWQSVDGFQHLWNTIKSVNRRCSNRVKLVMFLGSQRSNYDYEPILLLLP